MTPPDAAALYAANEATWPAARRLEVPGWLVRYGAGGGRRVSSATATGPDADIAEMEAAQAALGQSPLAMVREDETELDRRLAEAGYEVIFPTQVMVARLNRDLPLPEPLTAFTVQWPPLSIQREIWGAGGIGPDRIAVMERAAEPKTSLLGRSHDRPAGTTFVAISHGIAMVHGLEVLAEHRRSGTARNIMRGATAWAQDQGAGWLAVLVTLGNGPANFLYSSLGMRSMTRYHYRSKHSGP